MYTVLISKQLVLHCSLFSQINVKIHYEKRELILTSYQCKLSLIEKKLCNYQICRSSEGFVSS